MITTISKNIRTLVKVLTAMMIAMMTTSLTAKEIYLPAKIWNVPENNDFSQDTSEFSYKRMRQTDNIAIFWSKKFGDDPMANPVEKERFNVDEILTEGERIYKYYVNDLKFVEKGKTIMDKYKCLIFIINSKDNTAFGGGDEDKVGIFWAPPARMSKGPFGALAHELGHSFQYLLDADKGLYNPESAKGVGSYSFVEMTSQYMLWQVYPEWITFENYHLVDFMKQTHLAFLHESNMYHSPFVMEYWSSLHGVDIVSKIWRYIKKGEDPVMAYKRLTSIEQNIFNDEIFDAARRFITWDIKRIEKVSQKYANQHYTKLDTLEDGWFRISKEKCPQNYGYNGIRLALPVKGNTVKMQFEGLAGVEGYNAVNVDSAGWRYGFVAVKPDGSRVYSPVYSKPIAKVSFKIPEDTQYLWLVVSGAPKEHWIKKHGEKEEQWPYRFKGCNPYK